MMKNKDLQTLDMLRGEFEKSVDSAKVPLKLQKQSIVHMLEKDAQERKVQEEAEANKKYQVVTIKKLMAIAAALAVTVSGALAMQNRTDIKAKTDNQKSYESGNHISSAGSYKNIYEFIENDISATLNTTKPAIENPSNGQQTVTPEVSAPVVQPTENNPANNQQPTMPVVTEPVQNNPPEDKEEDPGYIYQETPVTEPENILGASEELKTNSSEGVARFEDFEADNTNRNGDYLYTLTTGTTKDGEHKQIIRVAKIVPGNQMEDITEITVSVSDNSGRIEDCVEIFFCENKLITISNSANYSLLEEVYRESEETVVVYYDISDPANPQEIHRHIQDGEYVSSRLCDNKLYIVTSTNIPDLTGITSPESIIPGTVINGRYIQVSGENVFCEEKSGDSKTFKYATVTDVSELSDPVQFAFYGGNYVSCHADTIVISRRIAETNPITGAAEDYTYIYRFNVNGDKITCADLVSVADGIIVGGIYVDEKKGTLRVVTHSTGGYNVYVFNEQMECVDTVEDVLTEETVEKVKYISNRVYLVYGENTSIIDFSKKLSVENIATVPIAISTNLYEVTSSVLLGIGFAGEEKKTVLTLFDFSNPENFKSTHEYQLDEKYTFAAGNDGRCIMVDSGKKIFGIPVIRTDAETNQDVSSYLIFSVEGEKITFAGECIHDDAVVGDAAARCVYADGTIYTVSGNRIVSHSADDYNEISRLEF